MTHTGRWKNLKTGKTDYLSEDAALEFDDAQAKQYIGESVAAQGYYQCSRELGLSVIESMLNTFSVSVGEPALYPVEEKAE